MTDNTKIDEILKNTNILTVDVAVIKEHLKTLNGTVARHEQKLTTHSDKINNNQLSIAKLIAISGGSGGIIYIIIMIIQKMIGG